MTLARATAGLVCQTVSWDRVIVANTAPPRDTLAASIRSSSTDPSVYWPAVPLCRLPPSCPCVSEVPFTSPCSSDVAVLSRCSPESWLPSCDCVGGFIVRCLESAYALGGPMGQYMAGDYSVCLASIPCVMVAESCGVGRSFQPMRVTIRRTKEKSRSMSISAYV